MPFQSEKQRRFLHANHPEIAKRWERDYANGGILDINESEEIISDDGNDIELTAYNAAFDDPNDLSTGVKTLFMKKGGQAIGGGIIHGEPRGDRTGFWDPGGKSPGTSSTGGMRGETARETGIRRAATQPSPPKSSPVGEYRGQHDWDVVTKPGEGDVVVDTGDEAEEAYVVVDGKKVPVDSAQYHRIKADEFRTQTVIKVLKRKDLTKDEKRRQLKYHVDELKKGKQLLSDIKKGAAVHPVVGLLVGIFQGNKLKKEQDAEIAGLEKQLGLLEEWGMKTRHHTVDTPTQILEQRILNLTQTRDDDDPENNEGPEPIYTPLTGEVSEEYAQGLIDPRDWMAEIRARQAARAAAVPDWQLTAEERELKNNPIVMTANSGGLANLFRVKNNQ